MLVRNDPEMEARIRHMKATLGNGLDRRNVLGLLPGALAVIAAARALMVPALAADAKSSDGTIEVAGPWARLSRTQAPTVYMDIINHGTEVDHLVRITSPLAQNCVLQKTRWKGLTMAVSTLESIDVQPMSRLRLKPGGTYIQLVGMHSENQALQHVALSLTFANAGTVEIVADTTVRQLGPAGSPRD
jgi:copper(I)-binding protein